MFNRKVIKSFIVFLINTVCSLSAMEVMVETRDGGMFTFTQEAMRESKFLTNMIADCEDTTQNPLIVSDVTSHEMAIIKKLSDLLAQQALTLTRKEVIEKCKTALKEKQLSMDSLIHLLNATNYLSCDTIMSISSNLLSNDIIKAFNTKPLEDMLKMGPFNMPAEMSSLVASMVAKKYGFSNNLAMPKSLINEIKNNPPSHVVFSCDKSHIALVMDGCSKVIVWSMQEDRMIVTLPSRTCITALSFSPSKDTLAIASEDNNVRFWHLATKKYRLLTTAQAPANCLSFSQNGTTLVTSSQLNTKKWLVQEWNIASLKNNKNYEAEGPLLFNSQDKLIKDKTKTVAYKKMVELWHMVHPDLQHDIQTLLIEDVLTLRWLVEMISINGKIQLQKAPALVKETVKKLMKDKPVLASVLQPYFVDEKSSWCAIS